MAPSISSAHVGTMALSNGRDTNRAQIFEDEKRRIIDSCFNKRDEDGSSKALLSHHARSMTSLLCSLRLPNLSWQSGTRPIRPLSTDSRQTEKLAGH